MLVIGFNPKDNFSFARKLDVDPDIDEPGKIHDMLRKAAKGVDFVCVLCVQDDEVAATFVVDEDYDLSESSDDEDDTDDDDDNPDKLYEDE